MTDRDAELDLLRNRLAGAIPLDEHFAVVNRLRTQLAVAEADADRLAEALARSLARRFLAGDFDALAAHQAAVEARTT